MLNRMGGALPNRSSRSDSSSLVDDALAEAPEAEAAAGVEAGAGEFTLAAGGGGVDASAPRAKLNGKIAPANRAAGNIGGNLMAGGGVGAKPGRPFNDAEAPRSIPLP